MSNSAKLATLALIVFAATCECSAQRRPVQPVRSDPTFGRLADNNYLQRELRLSSDQIERLRQIQFQQMGRSRLLRPRAAKELGMTDRQRQRVMETYRKAMAKFRSALGAPKSGRITLPTGDAKSRDDYMKKLTAVHNAAETAMLKLLTKSQLQRYDKMFGKPVDARAVDRRTHRFDRNFGLLIDNGPLQRDLSFTEKQRRRMRELKLQLLGIAALLRDDVADELKLTGKQRRTIADLYRNAQPKELSPRTLLNIPSQLESGRSDFLAECFVRMKQAEAAMLKTLTAAQRRTFQDLQGREIDWDDFDGRKKPDV